VNLEHRGLDRITRTMEHTSRNISYALIVAALFMGSSILILASRGPGMIGFATVGVGGLIASAALAAFLAISNRRNRGS
jgi:ubiquinone biosynthesis protein